MVPPTIRTARKLMLGREIAHMMRAAGVSQSQVASILETSQSRIAVLLNGGGSISPGDLIMLADRLGFTDQGYLDALGELRRDNHKRGFWSTGHKRAYTEDMRLMIDVEKHADQIRASHTEVVSGLLQSEVYIRGMYADRVSDYEEVSVEDSIQSRLARQAILARKNPPLVHHVLSESCLRRRWAPIDAMCAQIEHLIKLSHRRNIMIQVMPFNLPPGRRTPIGTRFTLLRAPSPGVAGPLELCYLEGEWELHYLDDKKALAAYDSAWARLTACALSPGESRAFMTEVLNDFQQLSPSTAKE